MFWKIVSAAMLSTLAVPAALMAQAATLVAKPGMLVTSSDGKRIGRIYDVEKSGGAVSTIVIIRDSQLLRIPASTLTAADKGLVTSMSNADLKK